MSAVTVGGLGGHHSGGGSGERSEVRLRIYRIHGSGC